MHRLLFLSILLLLSCRMSTSVLSLSASSTPIQHRIALLSDGMTVSWSTVCDKSQPIPVGQVAYGLSSTALNQTATAIIDITYNASTACWHHVELHYLLPSTTYYWQVLPADNTSPILSFTTAPPKNDPFNVIIYGDLGIDNSENTLTLLRKMKSNIDLIWHIGDISYANDYLRTDLTYEEIYEGWMNNMTDIWNEIPYMYCPGNHEVNCKGPDCIEGQNNFTSYLERFHMPYIESNAINNMYFSWNYGPIHFISINTESDFPDAPEGDKAGPFGDMAAWLDQDLKAATKNRMNVPWIFVAGHRPFYSSSEENNNVSTAIRDFFFPIMEQYDIDIVFVGHIHYYERTYPMDYNENVCSTPTNIYNITDVMINNKGPHAVECPTYIVSGAAGNVEGLSHSDKQRKFSAMKDENYGIGLLTVHNSTAITWTYIHSNDSSIVDQITLVKDLSVGYYVDKAEQVQKELSTLAQE